MSINDDNKIEPLAILIGNRQSGTWRAAEWSLAERILTAGWMKPEDDTLVATWGEVQDLQEERAKVARIEALIKDHWINLANSTDGYLARNYGLVVTVDDLNDALCAEEQTPEYLAERARLRAANATSIDTEETE